MLTKHLEPKQLCRGHSTPPLLKVREWPKRKMSEPSRVLAASAGRHSTCQPVSKSMFIVFKYVTNALSLHNKPRPNPGHVPTSATSQSLYPQRPSSRAPKRDRAATDWFSNGRGAMR